MTRRRLFDRVVGVDHDVRLRNSTVLSTIAMPRIAADQPSAETRSLPIPDEETPKALDERGNQVVHDGTATAFEPLLEGR